MIHRYNPDYSSNSSLFGNDSTSSENNEYDLEKELDT
jgi:hypothetical protein